MSRKSIESGAFEMFFEKDLYDLDSVEESAGELGRGLTRLVERKQEGVRVVFGSGDADALAAAGELANKALSCTMERRS